MRSTIPVRVYGIDQFILGLKGRSIYRIGSGDWDKSNPVSIHGPVGTVDIKKGPWLRPSMDRNPLFLSVTIVESRLSGFVQASLTA